MSAPAPLAGIKSTADAATKSDAPQTAGGPATAIVPKAPALPWLHAFVAPSLAAAAPYKIDAPAVPIKLDQNESPWDLPATIKQKVIDKLMARPWNRYPSPFGDELAPKIAAQIGVPDSAILLGPGSNYLITLLLSTFGKNLRANAAAGAKLVIARPSFPLYESHCQYDDIPYEAWELNADLEYDLADLPALGRNSVVIFASPNNPVGNVLPKASLIQLLERHPDSLFIADEAYYEYADEPFTDLVGKYPNIILLRTFSKTMGCAGVRIGYVIAHERYIGLLRKLRVPYLLNHFAVACAEVLLTDAETQTHLRRIQANAVTQREQVRGELSRIGATAGFRVKASSANFLLLRWAEQEPALAAYQKLIKAGILVRNVSGAPGLRGCLRVTLGTEAENQALLQAF